MEFYRVDNVFLLNRNERTLFLHLLIGSHFGPWIRTWKTSVSEANLGQCFIAIDPSMFEDEFEERLQKLIDYCRALPPSSKS